MIVALSAAMCGSPRRKSLARVTFPDRGALSAGEDAVKLRAHAVALAKGALARLP